MLSIPELPMVRNSSLGACGEMELICISWPEKPRETFGAIPEHLGKSSQFSHGTGTTGGLVRTFWHGTSGEGKSLGAGLSPSPEKKELEGIQSLSRAPEA